MARSCNGAALMAVVVVVLAVVQGSVATNFFVGGPLQWGQIRYNDPGFYQDWAESTFPYRTIDTLEFLWSAGDSVLLVDESDFITCNVGHPIAAWSWEGHVVIPLTGFQFRKMYFISGVDFHCVGGQKFFIEVYPAA